MSVAFTNVCFEQWLILHYDYSEKGYVSFDNLKDDSKLNEYCRNVGLSKYDKAENSFSEISLSKVEVARKNAIRLRKSMYAANDVNTPIYRLNPYTDFDLLLDAIDEFLK